MSRSRARGALPAILVLLLAAGCRVSHPAGPAAASKPGWGWRRVPEPARMIVRAVPAAARPREPVVRLGKPGWGVLARPQGTSSNR